MRNILFSILSFCLLSSNIQSQTSNVSDSQPIENDAVRIVNKFDPHFAFYFIKDDRYNNTKKFNCIEELKLFTDYKYLELTQNLNFEENPVFWCKAGTQYNIKNADMSSHIANMSSADDVANNEINFFQCLNDSLFKKVSIIQKATQIKMLIKKGLYSKSCREDLVKKSRFLDSYQKTRPISPLFHDLCKTSFYTEYVGDLIYAIKREPSNADSLKQVILNAKKNIQNDALLFSYDYKSFCESYNYFLAMNEYRRENLSLVEMYSSAKNNFTGETRDYLLFTIIQKNLNDSDIKPLLMSFYKDCNDVSYKNNIHEYLENIEVQKSALISAKEQPKVKDKQKAKSKAKEQQKVKDEPIIKDEPVVKDSSLIKEEPITKKQSSKKEQKSKKDQTPANEQSLTNEPSMAKEQLLTMDLEKISFQQILDQNKGKLVYMDFWVSWYKPSRTIIKQMRLMQDKYKDKVVFIYISKDKYTGEWKKASKAEKLTEKNSFCLTDEVDFTKEHDISSIPHYLLFGKNGELLNDRATGPKSKDFEELIKQALKNK